MSYSKRLSRLFIPLLLIGAAAGGAAMVSAPPAQAESVQLADGGQYQPDGNDEPGETHANLPAESKASYITANDHGEAEAGAGSGRENYYVPNSEGLPDVADPGKFLYEQGCSTCHGLNGTGKAPTAGDNLGVPSLIGVGEAAVDFYVGSGRMPLSTIIKQAPRKTPVYTQAQIDAIAKYVSSEFGGGPAVPKLDLEKADLVEGNKLYATNCAQCHNSAGSGGSLGRDYNAPRLFLATPTEIAEAIRIGPGPMPQWNEDTITNDQMNDLVAYVHHLGSESPGGLKLGATGPVPEGYFAWFVGIGGMLLLARWIGTRV